MGVADNITFGSDITDKSNVEERIRRAQRAILNPSTSYETFLSGPDGDPDGGNELSFSKNCVCLNLRGPDLTDLSFCDLPGMCIPRRYGSSSLTSGHSCRIDRQCQSRWKHLGHRFSQGPGDDDHPPRPSCLILLTVTCESKSRDILFASLPLTPHPADFENQGTHHMAKQYDPDGERTIGS